MLEAFYFRKPVLINCYSIYVQDIKPKGFDLVEMDGYVTRETVESVARLLRDEHLREQMVETNYCLGRQHYGFDALQRALSAAFSQVPYMGQPFMVS